MHKVNRIEIIDQNGRAYVNNHVGKVEVSMQDGDRTMKIFLESKDTPNEGMNQGLKNFTNKLCSKDSLHRKEIK